MGPYVLTRLPALSSAKHRRGEFRAGARRVPERDIARFEPRLAAQRPRPVYGGRVPSPVNGR